MKWIKITTDEAAAELFEGSWKKHSEHRYKERFMIAWLYRSRKPKGMMLCKVINRKHDNDSGLGYIEVEGSWYSLQAFSHIMPVRIKRPVKP